MGKLGGGTLYVVRGTEFNKIEKTPTPESEFSGFKDGLDEKTKNQGNTPNSSD